MPRFRIVQVLSPVTPLPYRIEQKVFFAWRSLGGIYPSAHDARIALALLNKERAPYKIRAIEEYD
jgi:hypothetical protein